MCGAGAKNAAWETCSACAGASVDQTPFVKGWGAGLTILRGDPDCGETRQVLRITLLLAG